MNAGTLLIEKLFENAILPTKSHEGDLAYDLYAQHDENIPALDRRLISTGIRVRFPEGYGAKIFDRSGTALNRGLLTMGGVIDNGYRGPIRVILYNVNAHVSVGIKAGERIAQMMPIQLIEFDIREESLVDTETSRGEKGFGSSGLNLILTTDQRIEAIKNLYESKQDSWFEDLTPYTYHLYEKSALNIGWLSKHHKFETKNPPQDLVLKLEDLCINHRVHLFRGYHRCEFCSQEEVRKADERWGNGSIIVIGKDEQHYAAPALIHHYVKVHHYNPPTKFVEAVMEGTPYHEQNTHE